jgi:hypothetical protein
MVEEKKPPVDFMTRMSYDPRKDPNFPGPMPVINESEISKIITAETVIIGGGHGGVQCALAASEKGASVSVIERQLEASMTWWGEQIGHFNSRFLISRGLGPYDEVEIINEFVRCGSYRINPRLISLYVCNSGEMIDNMWQLVPGGSDLLDDDQCNVHQAYGNPAYPINIGGVKTWAGTLQFRGNLHTERPDTDKRPASRYRLKDFEKLALDRSRQLGAKWNFGHVAAVLCKENNRVTGVIAKGPDGKYVKFIGTRAVLVATGSVVGDTGLRLGLWAGGHLESTPRDSSMPPDTIRCFGMTSFLALNKNGERFCDESIPYELGPQIYRQPKGMVCGITDSKWFEHIKVNGLQHGNPDFGVPLFIEQVKEDMAEVIKHGAEGYLVRSSALSEREYERVWGANTLEELAGYLGYEGKAVHTFVKEIEHYNKLCYTRRDLEFGKDPRTLFPIDEPPYYAGKAMNRKISGVSPGIGLLTDNKLNVIDDNDEPIPGLYAVGDCLGGFFGLYYATPCGGVHIGSAMTLGRVLGKMFADT